MALLEKKMVIKKSSLPGAGKGLFTTVFIPKGTRIVEYKGQIVSWKEVEKMADDRNGYVFSGMDMCSSSTINIVLMPGKQRKELHIMRMMHRALFGLKALRIMQNM